MVPVVWCNCGRIRSFLGVSHEYVPQWKTNDRPLFLPKLAIETGIFSCSFHEALFLRNLSGFPACTTLPARDHTMNTRNHRVKNIVEHIHKKCREWFSPGRNIAIDESTIGFKGRAIFKCFNPQKPTKWGLCVYTCADSNTGFVVGIIPYFGNPTTESLCPRNCRSHLASCCSRCRNSKTTAGHMVVMSTPTVSTPARSLPMNYRRWRPTSRGQSLHHAKIRPPR